MQESWWNPMKSFQLAGIPCAQRDPDLLAAIGERPSAAGDEGGLRIALRNEAGEIYRVIVAEGTEEFEHISDTLCDMGWMDELNDDCGPTQDFQAIFSCRPA